MKSGSDGFSASRIDLHVGVRGRQVTRPVRHGTGLHVPGDINGRTAEDYELEVRDRAWQQQRQADAELVDIAPWSTR